MSLARDVAISDGSDHPWDNNVSLRVWKKAKNHASIKQNTPPKKSLFKKTVKKLVKWAP